MKKKISLLFSFIFCVIFSYAQFPNQHKFSSPRTKEIAEGMLTADSSVAITDRDTLNNSAVTTFGALDALRSDTGLYMADGARWIKIGNTIFYVRYPLRVDRTTLYPKVVLEIAHDDGLIAGGVVSWTGVGLVFHVTAATYWLNDKQYNSPDTTLTLTPADLNDPRIDLFIVDTSGRAKVLTGVAEAIPLEPQPEAGIELPLTSGMRINVGDTVPAGVVQKMIYNENLGLPAEWLTQTQGNPSTVNFNNTDNPYRNSKAAFVSSYVSGAQVRFVDYQAGVYIKNNVFPGDILQFALYTNGRMNNSIYGKFYDSALTATNQILLTNPIYGFNPNDSGRYQIITIPLSAFSWNRQTYTTLSMQMVGTDNSGAKGFYIDYVNIQSGLNNFLPQKIYVDSIRLRTDSLFQYVNGIQTYKGKVAGGGGAADRFGIEDILGVQDRAVDMQTHDLLIDNVGLFEVDNYNGSENNYFAVDINSFRARAGESTHYGIVQVAKDLVLLESRNDLLPSNVDKWWLELTSTSFAIKQSIGDPAIQSTILFPTPTVDGTYYSPLSVNGNAADSTGNITIATGGSTDTALIRTIVHDSTMLDWHIAGNNNTTASSYVGTTGNFPLRFKSFGGVTSGFTGGGNSVAFGYNTYRYDTAVIYTFSDNAAFGLNALGALKRGSANVNSGNTANGYNALANATGSYANTAIGAFSMSAAATSSVTFRSNAGLGTNTLFSLTSGIGDVALGDSVFKNMTSGNYNVGLGAKAAWNSTTLTALTGWADNNLFISDSVYHMHFKLDSAAGVAPSVIGKDASGNWHVYAVPSGGGGSARFGFATEDDTPGEDRTVTFDAFKFKRYYGDAVDYLLPEMEIWEETNRFRVYTQNVQDDGATNNNESSILNMDGTHIELLYNTNFGTNILNYVGTNGTDGAYLRGVVGTVQNWINVKGGLTTITANAGTDSTGLFIDPYSIQGWSNDGYLGDFAFNWHPGEWLNGLRGTTSGLGVVTMYANNATEIVSSIYAEDAGTFGRYTMDIFPTSYGIRFYNTGGSSTLRIALVNLPVYANDAAAGAGGVLQDYIYMTATGELRVKL